MKNTFLYDRLREFGDRSAVIWENQSWSYHRLLDGISGWNDILLENGVKAGDCVALCGDFSPNVTMLFLALMNNGNIIVPLSHSTTSRKEKCIQTACVRSVFEFDGSDAYRFQSIDDMDDHPLLHKLRETGEPGLIIFSSGSTGELKAALHNLQKLLSKFEKKRHSFVTLAFLLFDHIGGINTLLYSLCNGGTLITGSDRTVEGICQTIEQHKVNLLPTTPTFIKMLAISEMYKQYNLSSLEMITYGTEPMHPATLEAAIRIFPRVKFKQTYGLTETGILSSKSKTSESLGMKVGCGDCEIKVVNGVLHVRSDTVMLGYLNASAPIDDEGFYNTGDVVEPVEDGYFRILGRESEIINVAGEKVFPGEIENVILKIENIKDVTVRGISNPVTGSVVTATVELEKPETADKLEQRVREFCEKALPPYMIPALVEIASEKLYGGRFKKTRRS